MSAVVSAQVTPGVTILSTTSLAAGVESRTRISLPNLYTAIGLPPGTGAGQVSVAWSDTRTYAASTPVTLDLSALAAAAGNTGASSFSKVKVLHVQNNEAPNSGKDLVLGAAAAAPFVGPLGGTSPTIEVPAGCSLLIYTLDVAGWPTAGAANLKIDPGASAVNATITLAGN